MYLSFGSGLKCGVVASAVLTVVVIYRFRHRWRENSITIELVERVYYPPLPALSTLYRDVDKCPEDTAPRKVSRKEKYAKPKHKESPTVANPFRFTPSSKSSSTSSLSTSRDSDESLTQCSSSQSLKPPSASARASSGSTLLKDRGLVNTSCIRYGNVVVEGHIFVSTRLAATYRFALKLIISALDFSSPTCTAGTEGDSSFYSRDAGSMMRADVGVLSGFSGALDSSLGFRRVISAQDYVERMQSSSYSESLNALHPNTGLRFQGTEPKKNVSAAVKELPSPFSFDPTNAHSFSADAKITPGGYPFLTPTPHGTSNLFYGNQHSSEEELHSAQRSVHPMGLSSSCESLSTWRRSGPRIRIEESHPMVDLYEAKRMQQIAFTPACCSDVQLLRYRTVTRYQDPCVRTTVRHVPHFYYLDPSLVCSHHNRLAISHQLFYSKPTTLTLPCSGGHSSISALAQGSAADSVFGEGATADLASLTPPDNFLHVSQRACFISSLRLYWAYPSSALRHRHARTIDYYLHVMEEIRCVKCFIRLPQRHHRHRVVQWSSEGVGRFSQPIPGKPHLLLWEADALSVDTAVELETRRKLSKQQSESVDKEKRRRGKVPLLSSSPVLEDARMPTPPEKLSGDELMVVHFTITYEPWASYGFLACPSSSDDEENLTDHSGEIHVGAPISPNCADPVVQEIEIPAAGSPYSEECVEKLHSVASPATQPSSAASEHRASLFQKLNPWRRYTEKLLPPPEEVTASSLLPHEEPSWEAERRDAKTDDFRSHSSVLFDSSYRPHGSARPSLEQPQLPLSGRVQAFIPEEIADARMKGDLGGELSEIVTRLPLYAVDSASSHQESNLPICRAFSNLPLSRKAFPSAASDLPSLQLTYRVSGLASGLRIKRLHVTSEKLNWVPVSFLDKHFWNPFFLYFVNKLVKLENKTTWIVQPVTFSEVSLDQD